ncbi:amyotrophic lateral sclerosis 2 chromosomal region candidate gene 12 protein [Microtus ochrogaster]|uniref:Amyotrophic lateral sclerosis 2 chromosomal region candidate gene 12 protein n=1 Tax=Microtus ochrogaster TaxID=79684 RepID=A0ABM1URM2_MICOH|nr:amyotrophic lateral sclerosis 2 chromosomal region candidate gene 12 protein [Microtus ochrogaster]
MGTGQGEQRKVEEGLWMCGGCRGGMEAFGQTHPTPVSRERNYLLSQPTKPVVSPKDKAQAEKLEEGGKLPSTQEVIDVSPGYKLIRNREQISVTLGDEMFNRKKHLESDILNKVKFSRTDIISDLEEQISELTAIIEQMNRDHQSAQKLLSNKMDLRCAEMKQKFENENRDLKKAHKLELEKLENSYKDALKVEKASAQEKLEDMGKEYKYLKNMFHMYQDSIYEEMEDKWTKRKAEWEKDEKLEREKILLQQKHRITKKFELESEEEKRKINESFSAVFENFTREKEELIKQHDEDLLQMQELRKSKEILEAELQAQAIVLETLNTSLYHCQLELQREKTVVGNLEKLFQTKLAEAEEKYKYTIQILTEENICLRQKMVTKNEMSDMSASATPCSHESAFPERR